MNNSQKRTKIKQSSAKDRIFENEQIVPGPSPQGHLNEKTDFSLDPSLIFDELPQPFRRINKVLEWIFDEAWTIIEQREKQRVIDQSKFVSAQHTSSTIIKTPFPISIISSHITGTLCFFNGIENEQSFIVCYDNQIDEIINQIQIEHRLKQMIVFKSDTSIKDTIYFLSLIDNLGYWRMFAYKNQQFFLLFTQYETEDDSKRPLCLMTQIGLNDEYIVVSWFANNDSWVEVYKLSKEQWKSEIAAQEQAMASNENQTGENLVNQSTENGSSLIRGQFSRPNLLFKARAPRFTAGSNNFQQLMKNTENQINIGQGITNHFYTQQIIDAKNVLIRDLLIPMTSNESTTDRPITIPKSEPSTPIIPCLLFIPAGPTTPGMNCLAVTWPTTNQLLIYKIAKSDSKGKEAFDTRPLTIWPFASQITSLTYDSKHEQLSVSLRTGNICIIERTSGFNEFPTIKNVSSSPIVDIHALDSLENSFNIDTHGKENGIFVLSTDGKIYRVQFQSMLNDEKQNEQENFKICFPLQQSKDTSKIIRMIFFNCNPSNLFLSINELNRIYINDALKCKQLCEIVLQQSIIDENYPIQIVFVDNGRSIIIGVPETNDQFEKNDCPSLRLYRVPLEHFPQLENYYPERIVSTLDEIESTIETKPSKTVSSQAKKTVPIVEVDKASILFDEKIKEMFHTRQTDAYERRERLRTRWNDIKQHFNPVYEQTT